jgi:hypothetical protein
MKALSCLLLRGDALASEANRRERTTEDFMMAKEKKKRPRNFKKTQGKQTLEKLCCIYTN